MREFCAIVGIPCALWLLILGGCGGGRGGPVVGDAAVNDAPAASITSPADGSVFDSGTPIVLEGRGEDPEEGALTGPSVTWTSDLDGMLGTGTALTAGALALGTHEITLLATDSGGLTGTDSISITVRPAPLLPPAPGELVITEMMIDPGAVSDTVGEWFEVFSLASGPRDLQGVLISDGGTDTIVIDEELVVLPGSYTVLGRSDDPSVNGGVPVNFAYGIWALPNGGGTIQLRVGATVIDEVTYTDAWPYQRGVAASLADHATTAADNDLPENWCASTASVEPGADVGSPGQANPACP